MSSTKRQSPEREEALARLREWLKPGDTVYTVLRHRSRSGMQREIGLVLIEDGAAVRHPNFAAGAALGYRLGKSDGLIVGGCGMDMGFHVVYRLGSALWPDGYGCIGKGCRSCDHSNGDRDYTPHSTRSAEWATCDDCCSVDRGAANLACSKHSHWHRDSGYALRQEWI